MISRSALSRLSLVFILALSSFTGFSQEAATEAAVAVDIEAGKTLFKNLCAACHNRDMKSDLTGPALGVAEANWSAFPQADLYNWIRNSQAMVKAGHPRAVEVYNQWKQVQMTAFTSLTDPEIANILAYINCTYTNTCPGSAIVSGPPVDDLTPKTNNRPLFFLLVAMLGILAIVLARILSNLDYMLKVQEGTAPARRKTLVELLTSRGVVGVVIFSLIVLGGYSTVNNAVNLGRQQGYAPEQPIKFSHATHAGLHKIDCQYCHDGARRSKQSVIPAANTCMNCHTAIDVGSQYGTAEITKIYASIGWDPVEKQYIENYDDMTEADIEKVYRKWISNIYVRDMGDKDPKNDKLEKTVNEQWKAIKASLTNETKKKIQGPIEWVRIHNLPDHAYFNHAQHVAVGKVECQTCHGPVEAMEVVAQHSPLSMGWCVNCHRQTEVKFAENEYYQSYERLHEELKKGERKGVTVEEIGGLECQKCHY
ncbi:MAG: c-type cytochrome [Saprospiraceae bacterium]|nr:c-type cytochrome [Saprospiraceae bacterium]